MRKFGGAYFTLMLKWLDIAQSYEFMWLYKKLSVIRKSFPLYGYSKEFEVR